MTSDEGFVAFNLVCYDKETLEKAFSLIREVDAAAKYYIAGEEELNKVVYLSKSPAVDYSDRVSGLEKLLKKWDINKGLWLTEMKVQQQIDRITQL